MDANVEKQYREGLVQIYRKAALEGKLESVKNMVGQKVFMKLVFAEIDQATSQKMLDISDEIAAQVRAETDQKAPMPVGRIDYLSSSGVIRESIEYHNEKDFVAEVLQSNYCGEPMCIVVYSDPGSGTHIDTSWRSRLDPPPQGFAIQPYENAVSQEAIASEVGPEANYEPEM